MTNTPNEFRFLPDQAAGLGITGPIASVARHLVDSAAGQASVLVWGANPGITLVHGAGLNAHTWDQTVLALGEAAIAIDLPGHGDSPWRDDFDYRPQTIAPAVAAAIDEYAHGQAQLVVGHSLGGLTAIALAAERPELVRALVLVDVSPGLRPGDSGQVRDFLAGPQVFASRADIVDKALAAGIGTDRSALERGVELNTRIQADGTVIFKHHLANPPAGKEIFATDFASLWPALENLGVPVLLVRATRGFLSTEVVAEFAARVPQATIVEIEAGHNVHEQQPAELARLVVDFLSTVPSPSTSTSTSPSTSTSTSPAANRP
ncbi:MAG: alpha/beta hydrolase fold protein [Glaciihabitans sp.]|nr:alpha/beta hydrolase fold protein [Glaciihabitans sp.]